jgi:pimeloyl-ACP methyl ester carboxylesterase
MDTAMNILKIFRRNKLAVALCLFFVAFLTAPLYFNRDEPLPGVPQYKCRMHITDPDNDPRTIARPNDDIKVIRLTNAGEYANRCELTNALYELNWDRPRPAQSYGADTIKPNAQSLPKLVVLYIQGWRHNAASSDSDRIHFEDLIGALRQNEPKKRVVGIYIGWNAEAPLWGWLEYMTFWVKGNNADRIAQSSTVTEIISAVGSIVRSDPKRQDQFIAIGHSFGARILFSAAAQPLVSAVHSAHPGHVGGEYKVVRGIADAIVLLNPAFEAARFSALNRVSRTEERFSPMQPPLLVAVSSEADVATTRAFPVGQWLGLARSTRELRTLGNHDPFITHSLEQTPSERCTGSAAISEIFASRGLCLRRLDERAIDQLESQDRVVIQPHNPFIVARTTSQIIKDHNDIWNPTFRTWLADLITALEMRHDAFK